jgi:hypothetical protein
LSIALARCDREFGPERPAVDQLGHRLLDGLAVGEHGDDDVGRGDHLGG